MFKKKFFDYKIVFKYCSLFCLFLIFNNLESPSVPYSISIMVAALYEGYSFVTVPILLILSLLPMLQFGLIASCSISAFFFIIVGFIYKHFNIKPKFEYSLYVILSLIGYIIIGDTTTNTLIEKRLFSVILISFLSFLSSISLKAISEKGLKIKLGVEEYTSISILTTLFGLGLSNLISPYLWKGLSVLIVLLVCYLFSIGKGTLVSAVLGISLAIYYQNINYISVFVVLGLVIDCLMPISRYISAIAVIIADYVVYLLFNIYPSYNTWEFLPIIIGATIFIIIPSKPLKKLKDSLYLFREKQLVRYSINQNRLLLSNKLYDISSVFLQMSNSFNQLNGNDLNNNNSKNIIEKKLSHFICNDCENNLKCNLKQKGQKENLNKLIEIAFAKGKISVIDLPKEVLENCSRPKDIIYYINKLMADYRSYMIEKNNIYCGRKMICDEIFGVSKVLKSLALETGSLLKYQSKIERKLADCLFKHGYLVSELLIFGELNNVTVNLIIISKEYSINELEVLISNILGYGLTLEEKNFLTDDKTFLSFSKSKDYEVAFGLAQKNKDSSTVSGDTHSILRISKDKYLVAISDGMGSGEKAQKISDTSLSLIESLYKVGMDSELILNTVNKLLAISLEDSYTALDIAVIDLDTCNADFIKYGAPYGYIISENGIKIIEGNSLPLGIVDELKPSVCNCKLIENDIVLLVSDGISDSFGSTSDLIDFLRTIPALNPQSIANQILEKALSLTNGKANDDMTALSFRLFSNKKKEK